jgi:hypothetical protein
MNCRLQKNLASQPANRVDTRCIGPDNPETRIDDCLTFNSIPAHGRCGKVQRELKAEIVNSTDYNDRIWPVATWVPLAEEARASQRTQSVIKKPTQEIQIPFPLSRFETCDIKTAETMAQRISTWARKSQV